MMKRTKKRFKADADWWKKAIRQNGERQQKEKTASVKKHYDLRLGQGKHWKPKPVNDFKMKDLKGHRNLPKAFVFEENLSLAAKAVYPVLCCLADFEEDKQFQESQENIGRRAGMTAQAVREAIDELQCINLVQAEKHKDEVWLYSVWFIRRDDIPEWKGEKLLFHRCIIESGIWAELTLRQKVFYLGLRAEGKPDPDLGIEIMEEVQWSSYEDTYEELYGKREHDLWVGSRRKFCDRLGMADVNIRQEVIEPLESAGLVRQMASDYWSAYQVNLIPDNLKKQIRKRKHAM